MRKPTVAQRMNRKQASYCSACPTAIYTASEAVVEGFVSPRTGDTGYVLLHKSCAAEYTENMAAEGYVLAA